MSQERGFTLLELLIVIAIIAILSVILIIVLNPAESLAKARDVQRISDLSSVKTALGIYLTTITSPQLDGTTGTANALCVGGSGIDSIWLSVPNTAASGEDVTDESPATGFPQASTTWRQETNTASTTLVDGYGWLPVKLSAITGGSPISNMPIDPVNDVSISSSTAAAVNDTALMYRYVCRSSPLQFEINTTLESTAFTNGGSDDKVSKDGGNNSRLLEMGTDLTLLPGTMTF